MENTYSITVTNKFSLALDEDVDPLELLKIREQEKEAKKKEKLLGKENKSKQTEPQKPATIKTPKSRVIKDAQQTTQKTIEPKKADQVEKKPSQVRTGERNVKFSGESREDQNNRRNREDGDRPPRNQTGEFKSGPLPDRESRGDNREFRNYNDKPRGDRGDRGVDRGDRGDRGGDRGDMNDRRPSRGGARGGSRGGRGGQRGGRGGFDNRGKREYDRQSGSDKTHGYSGVKSIDKKDGAGSYNWGTHNDDIEDGLNAESNDWNEKPDGETAPVTLLNDSKDGSENPSAPAANADAAAVEEKPAEEEAKELTLDEWKALRGNREKPTYNLRKAGEGEDLTRWKKMYALEKKKEGAEEEEDDEEDYDAAAEYPQRVGRQKRVYDIEIQFSDSRRGAGGRGGRGGRGNRGDRPNGRNFGNRRDDNNRPEGGSKPSGGSSTVASSNVGGQSDQRSPRNRQNAPKVDDEHDFPSLG